MGFGSPWILWALAAIAVPIIIHLFYFRRYKKVYFSDITFLKEAIVEQKRTGRLKNILILLSRILAVIFLVLAFALPFLGDKKTATSPSDKLVIYIDNTFSMSQLKDNRTLLDEVKWKALALLEQLDAQRQVMILTNDLESSNLSFYSPAEAKKILENISFSSTSLSVENWNMSVAQLMKDLHEKNIHIYYFSDFQTNALPQKWDSLFVSSTLISIQNSTSNNISVDSISLIDPIFHRDAVNRLLVKIKNQGPEISTQIQLSAQGEVVAVKDIVLQKDQILIDTLSLNAKSNGWQKGQVMIQDVGIAFDNNLYFAVDASVQNKVLLIEEVTSPKNIYQVFQSDRSFIIQRQSSSSASISQDYSLIVLNQVQNISNSFQDQLVDFVRNGGNLYIIPDDKNALVYNSLLGKLSVGQYSERRQQASNVIEINEQDPIVSIAFEKFPKNIDLPKVLSFWTITSSFQVPEVSILKLDNGRPFIQKYSVEKGIVYLQAASLDLNINDFASKSIFPPLIYNFAVIKSQARPLYYTIGKNQQINDLDIANSSDDAIKFSNGSYEIIPPIHPLGQQIGIEVPTILTKDGVFDVTRGEQLISVIACNYDRKESEMKFLNTSQLKEKFSNTYIDIENDSNFLQKNNNGILKSNTTLWKLCVILALLFLIVEILLIRFSNRKSTS
jgi:preprotein translocase subunit SecG